VIREVTTSAATVEEAIKKGAEELGVPVDSVSNEVLTEPKKGFLGFGAVDAKVRVFYEVTPAIKAKEFIQKVVSNMGIDCKIVESEKTDDGVKLTTNPVTLLLGGLEIVVQSIFTILEGEGKIITERRILNDVGGEKICFYEYLTGAFGTTEYQADMTNITLGVDGDEMKFSYQGRRIEKNSAKEAYVTIPEVNTTIEIGGEDCECAAEEGIAFSPVYHLALSKTITKGGVKTWLNLKKAN
jgi:hypothetical protein